MKKKLIITSGCNPLTEKEFAEASIVIWVMPDGNFSYIKIRDNIHNIPLDVLFHANTFDLHLIYAYRDIGINSVPAGTFPDRA